MRFYPDVTSEIETLRLVLSGRSIARYGDGEFKMAAHNASIKSQTADPRLSQRLRDILHKSGECLVGIPNIRSNTPKAEFWGKHMRFFSLLRDRPYVSSFITRPDSAPWIDTPEYWAMVESLWKGRKVTLVRGSTKSLVADDLTGAGEVIEIVAPRQHAWAEYDSLVKRIGTPERAILCLGPSATVMAVDLCARGVHAIDFGHIGLFVHKRRRGERVTVLSEADRNPTCA